MPQIREVQCIYWSSLHPSPVPLLPNAINTLAGPNGSCKTSFMDAVKMVLGVHKLFEDRSPNAYIYEDPVRGETAAPHAVVKVTFCNPLNEKGRRPFGLIAAGMDMAEDVTAVCRILRNGRREYALIAGQLNWTETSAIEPDLHKIRQQGMGTGFVSPEEWNDRVLRRIGVTRALQSVLAIDQFETASLTRKKPEELLDAILQIAGEQTTRQRYEQARVALATAEQGLVDAGRKLREEELRLKELKHKKDRHLQYVATTQQAREFRRRERNARWRDAEKQRVDSLHENDQLTQKLSTLSGKLDGIASTKLRIQDELAALSTQLNLKRNEYTEKDSMLRIAEGKKATLFAEVQRQTNEINRLACIPELDIGSFSHGERQLQAEFRQVVVELSKTSEELENLEARIMELQSGRAPSPPGLRDLLLALEQRGARPAILGEHLRFPDKKSLEVAAAVLGDRAWAVAVEPSHWYEAKQLAALQGVKCELVTYQSNTNQSTPETLPGSVLATCTVDDSRFLPILHEWRLSATLSVDSWEEGHKLILRGASAVASADGSMQTALESQFGCAGSLLTFSIEEQLRISLENKVKVERDRDTTTERQNLLQAEISRLEDSIREQQERVSLPEKRSILEQVEAEYRNVCEELVRVESERNAAQSDCEQIQVKMSELGSQQNLLEADSASTDEQIRAAKSRQKDLKEKLEAAQELLKELSLLPEETLQAKTEDERVEVLQAKAETEEANMGRFEEDVRGPEILADHEAQQARVETVHNLVGGRQDDAAKARDLCERARADYHEYLKRFGERLAASFRETCADCGADGDLSIRGFADDRPHLHVAVAHNRGERLISYRETPHSGGQRAKISMLLLIAAMGLDGSTDFMVLDEPTAHMSGNVIRQVNQLLENLVHTRGRRVQFMFAVPTKAENEPGALLADQQILFFLRRPGEAFNPPVVRMIGQSAP